MARPDTQTRPDIYARVTDAIIADLERGTPTWTRPWSAEHLAGRITRPLRHNGEPYSGINVILLWSEAVTRGFNAPTWMTFRQALALGGHVRKGETGSTVVYANGISRTETDSDGRDVEREIPFLKAYTVFNVDQVEALPGYFYATVEPQLDVVQRIAHADAFFTVTGADIRHGGDSAYYAMHPDYVQLPPFECFADPESYYAILAHECTHDAERRIMPRGRRPGLVAASLSPVMDRHKIRGVVPDRQRPAVAASVRSRRGYAVLNPRPARG